ncbi:TIGR02117 family protein [soil metagenome]
MAWAGRRWLKGAAVALSAIAVAILLPMLAIVAGSLIPANRHWAAPRTGVAIYVYSNGVHTGLVLPAVNPLHDWRGRVRASDLRDPRRAGRWMIFGWGERNFYLGTPQWKDVDPLVVVHAAVGSDRTLMHVDHLAGVWAGPDLRRIMLSAAQYRALAAAIDRDFTPGAAIAGYGADDIFYPARGRYDAVRTCNEWTGAKLRGIGVRVGLWTPTAWSVMRWF